MDVKLVCVDPDAATACAQYLREHGIDSARPDDNLVLASMTPPSVIRLAEDALNNGWAHDDDAAAIIAAMSEPRALVPAAEDWGNALLAATIRRARRLDKATYQLILRAVDELAAADPDTITGLLTGVNFAYPDGENFPTAVAANLRSVRDDLAHMWDLHTDDEPVSRP